MEIPVNLVRLFLVFVLLFGSPGLLRAGEVSVVLFHLNDVYQLAPPADAGGGMPRAMQYLKDVRAESKYVLATFGGDALSPSVVSSQFKGKPMLEALGLLGVEVGVLGNHEFDYGPEVLRERLSESRFPWLATNMREAGSERFFPGTQAVFKADFGGIRVCLIGLVTEATPAVSRTDGKVVFSDPLRSGGAAADALRAQDGCHAVVALTHLAVEEDRQLARAGKVDVILGGHDHYVVSETVGKVPIFKAGSDAQNLAVVTLRFDDVTKRLVGVDGQVIPLDVRIAQAPEMLALVAQYQDKLVAALAERIGETSTPLDALTATVRSRESAAGYLVADAYREALQADIALVNGGALRTNAVIPAGPVTRLDIKTLLPFENKVVKVALSGAELQAVLERVGAKIGAGPVGRFPHVAGMSLVFDAKDDTRKRPLRIAIAGAPLEPARIYTLAVSDYLAGGNGGYDGLKNAQRLTPDDLAPIESEVVMDFVIKRKVLSYGEERRVTFR